MAKTELIIVRADPETKLRIAAAARRLGRSVTTFMLEAALKAAGKVEAMPTSSPALQKPKGRGACPSYFMALCQEAKRGGANGYWTAGHELARHVAEHADAALDSDDWDGRLDGLQSLIDLQDDEGVLAWFDSELPRCMKLVPARRRQQFLKGVYAMVNEDSGDLRR